MRSGDAKTANFDAKIAQNQRFHPDLQLKQSDRPIVRPKTKTDPPNRESAPEMGPKHAPKRNTQKRNIFDAKMF